MSTKEERSLLIRYLRALQKEQDGEGTRFGDKKRRASEEGGGEAKRQATREAKQLGTTLPNILQTIPPEMLLHILRESVDWGEPFPKMWLLAKALRAFVSALSRTSAHFLTILSDVRSVLYALDPPLARWEGLVRLIEEKHRAPQGWINWMAAAEEFFPFTGTLLVAPWRKGFVCTFLSNRHEPFDVPRMEFLEKKDIFHEHPAIRTPEDAQRARAYTAEALLYQNLEVEELLDIEKNPLTIMSTEQLRECKDVAHVRVDYNVNDHQKYLILLLQSISNDFTLYIPFRLMVIFSKHPDVLFPKPLPHVKKVSIYIVVPKTIPGFFQFLSEDQKMKLTMRIVYPRNKWPNAETLNVVLPFVIDNYSLSFVVEVQKFPREVKRFQTFQYYMKEGKTKRDWNSTISDYTYGLAMEKNIILL